MNKQPSINKLSQPIVQQLIDGADALRVGVQQDSSGVTIVDAGINHHGGLEAGRLISEICLGGLGNVSLTHTNTVPNWPLSVYVHSSNPVLACLGSQYAGWQLSHGEGKDAFYALGSGPGRAASLREPLYKELAYEDKNDKVCLVMEVDKNPPSELLAKMSKQCGVDSKNLTVILTPTKSLAGVVQVVARVLETALHKTHELKFPLERIVDGAGSAPLCPPIPDFVQAMGRTNDSILFAGRVQLYVTGSDDDAKALANDLPSNTSKDYGKPFAKVFADAKYDFYQIDQMLFSPAQVSVTAMESGNTFFAGEVNLDLLKESFGG
ncbi:MAG: methenyltetrahydromethanopterin cyclohydrolase [Gammaproteobacteria bacterium]|nr:methenyltetrahydromethanopterin cyclohydrolase [Gammaproteobacteria bacterium]